MGLLLRQSIRPVHEIDVTGPSLQLRILFVVSKPLRSVLYNDLDVEEHDFVLQYKKLLNLCLICGWVDHVEKSCFSSLAVLINLVLR